MKRVGYVRVSTKEQNPERQIHQFIENEIKSYNIYIDMQSGRNFNRKEYKKMKNNLNEGDILYLTSLDRLGRDYDFIKQEWFDLVENKKIDIVVLDMELLDTRQYKSKIDKLVFNIILELFSYMAEKERKNIKQRQREGIARAKENGISLGRPKIEVNNFAYYYDQVYVREKISAVKAMKELNISKSTFYRRKKEYEETKKAS